MLKSLWFKVYFSPVEKDMQQFILSWITGSGSSKLVGICMSVVINGSREEIMR